MDHPDVAQLVTSQKHTNSKEEKIYKMEKTKTKINDVASVFQTIRKDSNAIRILQMMSETFDLKGDPPHHTRSSAVAIMRGIVSGEFDVVPTGGGKGFWHEEGYVANEEQ